MWWKQTTTTTTHLRKKHSQIAAIPSKLGDVAQDAVEQQKQKAVERDLTTWPKMLKFGPLHPPTNWYQKWWGMEHESLLASK